MSESPSGGMEEHPVVTPVWLKALVEALTALVEPLAFIGPLGYRWWPPSDPNNAYDGWTIVVYPTPSEIQGGPSDGRKIVSGFCLNVLALMDLFSKVEAVTWRAPVEYNGEMDGPEVSVQGAFLGKRVRLRFFHLPPTDEPVACVLDVYRGRAHER